MVRLRDFAAHSVGTPGAGEVHILVTVGGLKDYVVQVSMFRTREQLVELKQ